MNYFGTYKIGIIIFSQISIFCCCCVGMSLEAWNSSNIPIFFHKYHLPELFTVQERCMSGKLFVSYWNSSRSKKAIDSSFSFSKVLCTTVKIRWPYACKKVPWATMKPKKKRSRVLTFLQHWPFQPFFGRRNSSLEQLLKYRALQKTKWRDSSALIILPTRRQVHQVFRRVASALKAAEKTRDFTLLFLLFFDPFLLHQKQELTHQQLEQFLLHFLYS